MKTRLVTTFIVLAATASCEKQSGEPTTAANVSAPTSAAPGLPQGDLEFMTKAAEGGMLEVKLGTTAAQRAASDDVKAFGDRMRVDHGQANALLEQLAMQKGVRLPTELDGDHEKKVDELGTVSGAQFDARYADDMVADHQEDVDEFERASKSLADADLRDWAAKTLPTLKMHLQMAKEMKAKAERGSAR